MSSIDDDYQVDAVVTWRPLPGVKNEDVLGLSVHGGVDTHIKVRGISPETKVVIREKKIDYGVCAVGIKQEKVSESGLCKRDTCSILAFLSICIRPYIPTL